MALKAIALTCAAVLATLCLGADEEDMPTPRIGEALYVFDNAFAGMPDWSIEKRAAILEELGYAGMALRAGDALADEVDALKERGLRVPGLYLVFDLNRPEPIDPKLPAYLAALDRETLIWLGLTGDPARAVEIVSRVADLAGESGHGVAIYPHVGFAVPTTRKAVDLARQVDRDNVGVMFNLCHEIMSGTANDAAATLAYAAPLLHAVTINGADNVPSLRRAIQRLDQGDYNLATLLDMLDDVNFDGPIVLQAYQVPGNPRESLTHSMDAWRVLVERGERAD